MGIMMLIVGILLALAFGHDAGAVSVTWVNVTEGGTYYIVPPTTETEVEVEETKTETPQPSPAPEQAPVTAPAPTPSGRRRRNRR